ncbi:MAG: dCMP deaminase family protein [Spirochaetales bacterium]|nr:dCMP deaminase family protein [Spirochaetales bacterium]
MKDERISKDFYYLNIAKDVSARATCLRRRFGAVIVNNDSIVSTGYNGAPRGCMDSITAGWCFREEKQIPPGERYEMCRSVHAEQNAIIHAGRERTLGATLYLSCIDVKTGNLSGAEPCLLCTKMIINAGIKRVVVRKSEESFIELSLDDMIKRFEDTFRK